MTEIIINAVAGLGIFLFGMTYLEEALKDASGKSFKRFLKSSTNTIPKSIATGALSTAMLQSSSVVSLMALSFVGAGIMQLHSGIGVIFGANIGTTFTSWIVAILGFKIKIEAIALPMVGVGGLILIFFKNHHLLNALSRAAIGFGLLFLGLEYLKSSTEIFANDFDLTPYLSYGVLVYILIGFVLTATIQSSSASTAIILSSLNSGIIDFPIAAAMVIGSNVGTTVTAIIGSIGGSEDKKRAALAHLIFNVATGIIAFLLLGVLSIFILETLGFGDDSVMALALFHTIFNLLGVLVFAPFIPMLTRFLKSLFKKEEKLATKYIHSVDATMVDASLVALRKESIRLYEKSIRFSLMLFNLNPKDALDNNLKKWKILANENPPTNEEVIELYKSIKRVEFAILHYGTEIGKCEISIDEGKELSSLLEATKEIAYATKILKDIKINIDTFCDEDGMIFQDYYEKYRERILNLFLYIYKILHGETKEDKLLKLLDSIRDDDHATIKELTDALKNSPLSDLLASSLIHANRSIFISSKSFYDVLKIFQNRVESDKIEEIVKDI